MLALRRSGRTSAAALLLGTLLWLGCSDEPVPTAPEVEPQLGLLGGQMSRALAAHARHSPDLLGLPGVVGTAVGLTPDGSPGIRVILSRPGAAVVPTDLDGIQVTTTVSPMPVAFSDPTQRQRPAPLGFSVGHPAITAGTIGARVRDGSGNVFILSNNHVLANSNNASIGDPTLQPGAFDGGTVATDQVGTLAAFRAINFSGGANTIDAALALTTASEVTNSTPSDDGYGTPSSTLWGDANADGAFDDVLALLGVSVQKYGRTTKLTQGQVTGVNATVNICYEVFYIWCTKSAQFVDQLIIEPGGFSGGGDSGALITTVNGLNPVGLLFAGSSSMTIANRIDLVLSYFGVEIDAAPSPPPTPLTDLALTAVSAPSTATQGSTVNVSVTVRNVGNQTVAQAFDLVLNDVTDGVAIGSQQVSGLAPGASATRTFAWNTSGRSLGAHTLRGSHSFPDENVANDAATTTVTVQSPSAGVHVGDLDASASRSGNSWSATVEVTIHDGNHQPVNGATVVGQWNPAGFASDTCTTGELGGNGTCIFLNPWISRNRSSVSFTVTSVTKAGQTYQAGSNHDPDGSSNGTTIVVRRP